MSHVPQLPPRYDHSRRSTAPRSPSTATPYSTSETMLGLNLLRPTLFNQTVFMTHSSSQSTTAPSLSTSTLAAPNVSPSYYSGSSHRTPPSNVLSGVSNHPDTEPPTRTGSLTSNQTYRSISTMQRDGAAIPSHVIASSLQTQSRCHACGTVIEDGNGQNRTVKRKEHRHECLRLAGDVNTQGFPQKKKAKRDPGNSNA
ncbi:hypothetical protein VKT23_010140 [Stygiomarasmius scandens]|uniref:Uncharacterized protein n=1 Tax=Marasmiellus scandens TaxID=2682957 RepID=A0ABR1JEW8_9AGAR